MSAINLNSVIVQSGELATVKRRYVGGTSPYGSLGTFLWGGGTYDVQEYVKPAEIRFTDTLGNERAWMMTQDMTCLLRSDTVAVKDDHIALTVGTFNIDVIRPLVYQGGTYGHHAFLKWLVS